MNYIYIQGPLGQIGPFTESHVRDSITQGTLSPQAIAWRQGREDWVPLYTLLNLEAPAGVVVPAKEKERHGCLIAFLGFIILMSVIGTVSSSAALLSNHHSLAYSGTGVSTPSWYAIIIMLTSIINLLCAIALITWKKWGFWGYLLSSITVAFFSVFLHAENLGAHLGVMLLNILGSLLMGGLLYVALRMGNKEQGWKKLS
jgi:hypothetical protein